MKKCIGLINNMDGLDFNSSFRLALGESGTASATTAQPKLQKVAPEQKADEFTSQTKTPEAKKRKSIFGIFGEIARAYKKGEVTLTEGTKGITDAAVKATAIGAVAYGAGTVIEGGIKVGKGTITPGEFIAAPFKAIFRGAASAKDVLLGAWDTRIGDAIVGTIKSPFKFIADFMSPTYVSKETKEAAFAARETARAGVKGIFKKTKAGKEAFKKIMNDAEKLEKMGGKKTRIVALAVGLAALAYGIVRTRLDINRARHGVDAGFIPTPILGFQKHDKKEEVKA